MKNLMRETRFYGSVLVILVAVSFLASCSTSAPKIHHVGLLSSLKGYEAIFDGFKAEMAKQGYVEGQNIIYDYQAAESDPAKMKQIAEKFVADKVDLLVVNAYGGSKAAQEATADTNIPIIFILVSDPVGVGFATDLNKPGGNMTGVQQQVDLAMGKRVEILHEILPEAKQVWFAFDINYSNAKLWVGVARQTAADLGLELVEATVSKPEDVVADLQTRESSSKIGFEAMLFGPAPATTDKVASEAMLNFAKKHNIPLISNTSALVEQGALFSYYPDFIKMGTQGASLADKILKGDSPAVIPILTADPELVINIKTAKTLGLTIDERLLAEAERVIE